MKSPDDRPPFLVAGYATIKHLNVRKEGPEDEQILAVDIKLEFRKVDRRLCDYFDPALAAFLWRGDTDALIVRNIALTPVSYAHEIASARASIDEANFSGAEIKKFSLQPHDGGVVTLTCSLTVYPSSIEVANIARRVQDDVLARLEGPPDLFAGEPIPEGKKP